MKKISFLFLAIFAMTNIYSQIYTIDFSGIGAATTVDSVKIENLTHPAIIKWHAGDILQFQLSNGINETIFNEETLQVFPNPTQGQTIISFYAKQAGNAKIAIFDISGKEVLQTEEKLSQAIQKYQLDGLKQGVYFIKISGVNFFYTTKLICQNTTAGKLRLKFIGTNTPETFINNLKSTNSKATVTMNCISGDSFCFTGYAGVLNAIVNVVPTSNTTITFAFSNSTTCGQPFTDSRDSIVYPTIQIGNQCWMGKNLAYLPSVVGPVTNSKTIPYYYVYGYNGTSVNAAKATANYSTYGVLYNWPAAMNGAVSSTANPSGVQGICPTGWHLPSDDEWAQLIVYLGGESIAGGKLKSTTLWLSPNTGATNQSGFTAFPGGGSNGSFSNIGYSGFWWSTTEHFYTDFGITRFMSKNAANAYTDNPHKSLGFSVRCIRD